MLENSNNEKYKFTSLGLDLGLSAFISMGTFTKEDIEDVRKELISARSTLPPIESEYIGKIYEKV